jgi:hypothetical protein
MAMFSIACRNKFEIGLREVENGSHLMHGVSIRVYLNAL